MEGQTRVDWDRELLRWVRGDTDVVEREMISSERTTKLETQVT